MQAYVLDAYGRMLYVMPSAAKPENYPHYTYHDPGLIPGPGAVYVGGAVNGGEHFGGHWVYDPVPEPDPDAAAKFVEAMNKE